MLLAVDVGNTQTVFGLFERERLTDYWRIATDAHRTGDELGLILSGFLDLEAVDGVSFASSVPALVRSYEEFAERWARAPILVLGPGVRSGIGIRYDDPRQVAPDRIANAVAAGHRYTTPCIVVDFGTSTNFDAVSAEGDFVGGVLAPGVEISMDALFARAARLTRVDVAEPPTVIGKTTGAALQSGLVYGFAGLVDGVVERMKPELGGDAEVIATGGLAELIAPHARTVQRVDAFLTLDGLRIVWERNH